MLAEGEELGSNLLHVPHRTRTGPGGRGSCSKGRPRADGRVWVIRRLYLGTVIKANAPKMNRSWSSAQRMTESKVAKANKAAKHQ